MPTFPRSFEHTPDPARRRPGVARPLLALSLSVALVALSASMASAATSGGWKPLGNGGSAGTPALNGNVAALNADAPGVVYVGGTFNNAGGKPAADRIAAWDGSTWSALDPISNGSVHAIAVHDGKVYAGGTFINAGGKANADFLAVWDGSGWEPFCTASGPAFDANVEALQIIGNTLYVGGSFHDGADLQPADGIVACDLTTGAPSSPFDSEGDGTGSVYALAADDEGTLYAGGTFQNLDGDTHSDFISSLDEAGWHPLGSTTLTGIVRSLSADGTDVYVGVDQKNIVGITQADNIAKWNGSSYSALGSNTMGNDGWFPTTTFLYRITSAGGLLFATGSFQNANGDPLADNVAYFDGTHWHHLGSDGAGNGPWLGDGLALAVFRHQLYAGGGFTSAGGDPQAQFAASFPILHPDARIGTNAAGPFIGNNVYNGTGAAQSKTISVARGHNGTLFLSLQNDGLEDDDLTVGGTGTATGYTVTYFHGTTNVTSQVKNGTYSTGTLAPGATSTLKMVVKLSQSSANSGTYLIKAKSAPGTAPDAVKAVVKAA
jgi:hypothetical protein